MSQRKTTFRCKICFNVLICYVLFRLGDGEFWIQMSLGRFLVPLGYLAENTQLLLRLQYMCCPCSDTGLVIVILLHGPTFSFLKKTLTRLKYFFLFSTYVRCRRTEEYTSYQNDYICAYWINYNRKTLFRSRYAQLFSKCTSLLSLSFVNCICAHRSTTISHHWLVPSVLIHFLHFCNDLMESFNVLVTQITIVLGEQLRSGSSTTFYSQDVCMHSLRLSTDLGSFITQGLVAVNLKAIHATFWFTP